jgi:ABC-type transporter lipoprotein component MlaA
LNPLFWVAGIALLPVDADYVVNSRANPLDTGRIRDVAALDPYLFTREAYRQKPDLQDLRR